MRLHDTKMMNARRPALWCCDEPPCRWRWIRNRFIRVIVICLSVRDLTAARIHQMKKSLTCCSMSNVHRCGSFVPFLLWFLLVSTIREHKSAVECTFPCIVHKSIYKMTQSRTKKERNKQRNGDLKYEILLLLLMRRMSERSSIR